MERIVMEDLDGGFVLVNFDEFLVARVGDSKEALLSDDDYYDEKEEEHDASLKSLKHPRQALLSDDDDYYEEDDAASLMRSYKLPRKISAVNFRPRQQRIEDLIKREVLAFLPAKSLYRFRTVSKDWDSWISGPFFAHEQSIRYTEISGLFSQFPGEEPGFTPLERNSSGVPTPCLGFLPEKVEVRATDGGLLCCRSHLGFYYICNPVTGQWTKLPEPIMYHGAETGVGITFEPSRATFSANYQVVCAVVNPTIDDDVGVGGGGGLVVVSFEVYSSRSCEWRVCSAMYCDEDGELGSPEIVGDGLSLNGYVYWETGSGKVLTFDVKNEDFGVLTLPPGHGSHGSLAVMDGELCYLLPGFQSSSSSPVIRVYGDMDMKLKRVISVKYSAAEEEFCHGRALALVRDKVVIAVFGREIVAYDVEAEKGEVIGAARDDGFEKFLPYVNSLAGVRAAGGEREF